MEYETPIEINAIYEDALDDTVDLGVYSGGIIVGTVDRSKPEIRVANSGISVTNKIIITANINDTRLKFTCESIVKYALVINTSGRIGTTYLSDGLFASLAIDGDNELANVSEFVSDIIAVDTAGMIIEDDTLDAMKNLITDYVGYNSIVELS